MGFDIEGYKKAAKEQGLSDEEIQKDIDEETKGIAHSAAPADMENVKTGKDFLGIPEWLQPALGTAAAGALLGGLGLKGYENIKQRMGKPDQAGPSPRVEPTFGIPEMQAEPQVQPQVQPQQQPQNKFTPPQGDVTDVASRPAGTPRLQIEGPTGVAPAAVAPEPIPSAPVAPPAGAAPAAVQPLTDKQRREKALADLAEHRLEEAKKSSAAKEAQQAETKKQTTTASGGIKPEDRQMLQSSENAKLDKAIDASQRAAAPKPASVVPPVLPALPVATAPEAALTTPTTPTEDVSAVDGGNKPSAAKRRTAEQIMSDKAEQQFTGAKKQLLTNLGNQYGEDYSKAAHEALGIAKERLGKGEKFSMEPGTGKVTEHWSKMKADMLANPEAYPDITVKHIQKSVEQVKKEVAQKKAAESQRGGANVNAIGEAGNKVAGAVKPILGQTGALVGSELKGAAAMLPFMLATDVQAQNAGYRRELEQQMKTERNASRSAELKSELKKLDEEKYLKAMKRRYVDRNVPAQFRPQ